MTSIPSLSGAQSAAQSGLQQLRLQQAKRDAERAEQTARALQVQAREAQQQASQAQQNARSIASQADQAQDSAGQARQGLAMVKTTSQMQIQLSNTVSHVTETLDTAQASATPSPSTVTATTATPATATTAAPVINVQGQVTGTVVNTTA